MNKEEIKSKIKTLKNREEQLLKAVKEIKKTVSKYNNAKKKYESEIDEIQTNLKSILVDNNLKRAYNYSWKTTKSYTYKEEDIMKDERFKDAIVIKASLSKTKLKPYLQILKDNNLVDITDNHSLVHLSGEFDTDIEEL